MNDQAIRFRLGIFVLGAFILLGVLIVLFGGLPGYFQSADQYTVVFDSAPGVSRGTPVRRSGVRIGDVSHVNLNNETGKVDVTINVNPEYTLRKQDQPMLVQGLLAGDSTIDFVPRKANGKEIPTGIVEPGAIIPDGAVQTDAGTLVQKISDVVGPAKPSMDKFDKLMESMEQAVKLYRKLGEATNKTVPKLEQVADTWNKAGESFNKRLADDKLNKTIDQFDATLKKFGNMASEENQKNLRATLKSTKEFSERLDPKITEDAKIMIKQGQIAFQRMDDGFKRFSDVLADLKKTIQPFNERGDAIARNLDESTDKLNRTMTDLRELMEAIARSDGTMQRLLSDPSLYNNLNASACMVSRSMPRLDRILRDLEIFSDKIARHPESLGLGGVIRPGSGLKEAPTVLPWRSQ